MSIKLISAVWEIENLPPTTKLVLLSLCDWANDKGESCYPSIKSIALKSSLSERHTQRIVHKLIELNIVSVIKNDKGGQPGTTRNYKIHINRLTTGDILTPVIDETGDTEGKGRVTSAPQTGDMGVTLTVKEPLNEPDQNVPASGKEKKELALTDKAISEGRNIANGWDIEILERKFLNICRSAKGFRPDNPDAAFLAWIPKYTKGLPPGEFEEKQAPVKSNSDHIVPYEPYRTPKDDWRKRLSEFRRNEWWQDGWGPKPGKSGCRVPKEMLV